MEDQEKLNNDELTEKAVENTDDLITMLATINSTITMRIVNFFVDNDVATAKVLPV